MKEAELIAFDEKTSRVAWSKRLTEDQWIKVSLRIVFQDDASTIKLKENGKLISGKGLVILIVVHFMLLIRSPGRKLQSSTVQLERC